MKRLLCLKELSTGRQSNGKFNNKINLVKGQESKVKGYLCTYKIRCKPQIRLIPEGSHIGSRKKDSGRIDPRGITYR
jgi:hypothetical protein